MSTRLTHVRLLVKDFPACFRFYRDVMALPVNYGDEAGPYAEFRANGEILGLFERRLMAQLVGTAGLPAAAGVQDPVCLCFAVDDVDQIANSLKAKGATVVTEPRDRPDWGIRTAHFRDPDGTLIEINKRI